MNDSPPTPERTSLQKCLPTFPHHPPKIGTTAERNGRQPGQELSHPYRHAEKVSGRIIQNRVLVFILGAIILLTIILAIYLNVRGH
uniref:Uncharacterized protein n=1 Tax=Gasterosteus aculeatus TaxID=69293 RepID=G3NBM6_GASAC